MTAGYSDDEILDGLTPEPAQPNPSTPRPAPVAQPAPHRPYGVLELVGVVLASVVLAAVATAWWLGPRDDRPSPAPKLDAVALGRTFAPKFAAALAVGFDADADALKAGKTFGEADQALKKAFHDANAVAFETHAGPALTAIIPDKDKIKDQAQRDALEAFHRDFAKGLRQAK